MLPLTKSKNLVLKICKIKVQHKFRARHTLLILEGMK